MPLGSIIYHRLIIGKIILFSEITRPEVCMLNVAMFCGILHKSGQSCLWGPNWIHLGGQSCPWSPYQLLALIVLK